MSNHSIKSAMHQFNVDFISGTITGITCAGAFNPWDRALYLSILYRRPFLTKANFQSPFQGVFQTISQRAFLGSIYYIMQSELTYYMKPYLQNTVGCGTTATQFYIGLASGSVNGLLNNSMSAVKYHTWGQENRSFSLSLSQMWHQGGYKSFIKGTCASIGRDSIFGTIYETTRHRINAQLDPQHTITQLLCNASAAGLATIASGPLNYARSIQYGTSPHRKTPTIRNILKDVWNESKQNPSYSSRCRFFQRRFRVGWGTARVATGMAAGQELFDIIRKKLSQ